MTVSVELTVGDLIKHDRVDLHTNVIHRNDGLGREIRDLLHHIDALGNAINKGNLKMDARAPGRMICTQTLNDHSFCLWNDVNVRNNQNDNCYTDTNE